jgi:tetratricopeptide (TPR) repeat protein
MLSFMRRLALCCAIAIAAAACSSHGPAAPAPAAPAYSLEPGPAPSLAAAQLHLSCLTPANELQQIKTCTAAINSGVLPQKQLSNALAVRGTLYLRLLRLIDARMDFEEAKRLDPGNPEIDRGIALLETAERQMSAEQERDVQAMFDCAELPDLSERIAVCDRLVAEARDDPELQAKVLTARAVAKLHARDPAGAVVDLDEAVALDPKDDQLKDYRSRALFMAERYEEALPGLEIALEQNPYDALVKSMVGASYYVRGDLRRAYSEFEAMRYWQTQEDVPSARAATIQSELREGENLFEQLAASSSVPRWLSFLGSYRTSFIPESEFRSSMATFLNADDEDIGCLIEFHIAHKAALERSPGVARAGFTKAVGLCGPGNFEYHAAKRWLLKLGSVD